MPSIIYEPKGRAQEYGALAANLYKGCPHGCLYCYAPAATFTEREAFHRLATPRSGVMGKFVKDCQQLRGTGKCVLLSFTCDPYSPLDVEHQLTRQAIQALHENGLSVEILTKGGSRAVRDFDLLGPADGFGTTLTFLDAEESQKWEPGAALPVDRMDAMQQAHARGIRTWVSLEPVIDPATSLEIIRRTQGYVDLYKVGTLNYHAHRRTIDWTAFGREAIALLESLSKNYYIKRDLAEKIPGYKGHESADIVGQGSISQTAAACGPPRSNAL